MLIPLVKDASSGKKYQGCYFRGKTPREWQEIREAQRRASEKMKIIGVSCYSDSRTCDFDARLQQ